MIEPSALHRLHEFRHWSLRTTTDDAASTPPFTFYIGGDATPRSGTALPVSDDAAGVTAAVAAMRARVSPGGGLRVEVIENLFPGVARALAGESFPIVERERLMLCTPETLVDPNNAPTLAYLTLTDQSPIPDVQEALNVNERGFDPTWRGATSADDAERFRRTLTTARIITARLDGVAVAGGMYAAPHAGVTLLTGIATLLDYRRRGIGATLSARMTRDAFAAGAELAFLAAATDEAARIYARIGYQPVGYMIKYDTQH